MSNVCFDGMFVYRLSNLCGFLIHKNLTYHFTFVLSLFIIQKEVKHLTAIYCTFLMFYRKMFTYAVFSLLDVVSSRKC